VEILWTREYFNNKFFRFFTALLFLICVYSLNVPVVSYLRTIMYDCVCVVFFDVYFTALAY